MQVFISYSRKDAEFVRALADDVKARGIEVWLDTEDLVTADDDRWRRSIVQGIRESTVLAVVLSPNSVASEQVERELTIAAETKRRIIPIVKSPCELPDGFQFELAGIQRIDFSELPRDVALEQLVRRVGAAPHTTPAKTPSPDASSPEARPPEPSPIEPSPIEPSPIEPPAKTPPAVEWTIRAAVGPASVHPPPKAVAPAFESSKTPTARPEPRGPTMMSAPGAPPISRPRRRLAAVLLGVGAAAVLAIVLLVVLRGGDEGDGNPAGPDIDQTTTVTSEDEEASGEPGATLGTQLTSPEASPAAPVGSAAVAPGPSEAEVDEMADALVAQLEQAYNTRDWDAVRRLNPEQSGWSDAKFVEGYGSIDGLPRLEEGHHVFLSREATSPTTRRLTGTIIAYDLNSQGVANTNVACAIWDADVTVGTVAQTGFSGNDGKSNRRLDGWLPVDHFESKAQQYCG